MQMLRSLYTNEVIQVMITVVLLCLNCAAVAAVIRLLHRKIALLKWITFTLTFVIMAYIVASALLFTVNWFGIRKALLLSLILVICVAAGIILYQKKRGSVTWGELDADLRPHFIPLFLVLVGLIVSWGNFGYFGMGQDQGVYQVKAINLMYGVTQRVYSFSEYEKLDTDEEKENLYETIRANQLGLDLIDDTWEENQVLASLRTGGNDTHKQTDGIFHGIPTYPALLALWSTIAGIGNMSGIQTLLYLLALLTLWFTAENLKLKKSTSALICLLFMLSPEVVWISKSTLTEELLALIIIRFIHDLTSPDQPQRRWWSAWMVVMFALVHVSVFVMIFMFLLLFVLLYLWEGDRQYIRALRISALGFMGGFTFMTLVAPRYTIRNTAMIWIGPVTLSNVYWIFMGIGLISFVLTFVLGRIPVRNRFRSFIQGNGFSWLLRVVIVLLLGVSVFLSIRKSGETGIEQAVVSNGMYNMFWMTGLFFLPVVLVSLIRKPQNVLTDNATMGITFLFGYAVLLMCCILKAEIQYCYYFGRYLTPYIPISCVMIGLVWNRFSGRTLYTGIVIGSLVALPFDMAMLWRQDDTFSTFETFSRVIESVNTPDSAVIFEDHSKMFMIPVKTMTRNECYFAGEEVENQAAKLATRYRNVFCITNAEKDWKPVTKIVDSAFMDDNHSFRPYLCPFPLSFQRIPYRYNVYKYEGQRIFTAADLFATVPSESSVIVLPKDSIQYGPYISLPPGSYEVHYYGSNLSHALCYPSVDYGIMLDYVLIQQSDKEVVFSFSSAVDLENVEFITKNTRDEAVMIEKITVLSPSSP